MTKEPAITLVLFFMKHISLVILLITCLSMQAYSQHDSSESKTSTWLHIGSGFNFFPNPNAGVEVIIHARRMDDGGYRHFVLDESRRYLPFIGASFEHRNTRFGADLAIIFDSTYSSSSLGYSRTSRIRKGGEMTLSADYYFYRRNAFRRCFIGAFINNSVSEQEIYYSSESSYYGTVYWELYRNRTMLQGFESRLGSRIGMNWHSKKAGMDLFLSAIFLTYGNYPYKSTDIYGRYRLTMPYVRYVFQYDTLLISGRSSSLYGLPLAIQLGLKFYIRLT